MDTSNNNKKCIAKPSTNKSVLDAVCIQDGSFHILLAAIPLSQPRYHHIPQRLQYELHFAGVGVVADDGVFVWHNEAALGGGTGGAVAVVSSHPELVTIAKGFVGEEAGVIGADLKGRGFFDPFRGDELAAVVFAAVKQHAAKG